MKLFSINNKASQPASLRRFYRTVAWMLCVCLLITDVAQAAPMDRHSPPAVRASGIKQNTLLPSKSTFVRIPNRLGTVDEIYVSPRGTNDERRTTVYYIQDAHDSLEAQENIAEIIKDLVKHQGVETVFEEGYEGPVPTDQYFSGIQDSEIKRKVAHALMDKLLIGGAEYAHITRFSPVVRRSSPEARKDQKTLHPTRDKRQVTSDEKQGFALIGADNVQLHLENIEWYRLAATTRKATQRDLRDLTARLEALAARELPKEAKEWSQLRKRFDDGTLDMLEYLKRLLGLVPPEHRFPPWSFPSLRGGKDSHEDTAVGSAYPHIETILRAEQIRTPESLATVQTISRRELFSEIDRLENDFARLIVKAPRHQAIFRYRKILKQLQRLNEIKISFEEYQAIRENLKTFKTEELLQFIVSQTHQPLALSKRWETAIQRAMRFYELAEARDLAMEAALKKHFQAIPSENASLRDRLPAAGRGDAISTPVVLVFGGFHKENIKDLLRRNGFSYVVITPKISEQNEKHEGLYRKLMSGGVPGFSLPALARQATRYAPIFERGEFLGQRRQVEALIASELKAQSQRSVQPNHSQQKLIARAEAVLKASAENSPVRSEIRQSQDSAASGMANPLKRYIMNPIEVYPETIDQIEDASARIKLEQFLNFIQQEFMGSREDYQNRLELILKHGPYLQEQMLDLIDVTYKVLENMAESSAQERYQAASWLLLLGVNESYLKKEFPQDDAVFDRDLGRDYLPEHRVVLEQGLDPGYFWYDSTVSDAFKKSVKEIEKAMDYGHAKVVLHALSGVGRDAFLMARRWPAVKVLTLDANVFNLREALELLAEQADNGVFYPNLRLIHTDARISKQGIPLPDNSVDQVLFVGLAAASMLRGEVSEIMREIFRVTTKNNGKILFDFDSSGLPDEIKDALSKTPGIQAEHQPLGRLGEMLYDLHLLAIHPRSEVRSYEGSFQWPADEIQTALMRAQLNFPPGVLEEVTRLSQTLAGQPLTLQRLKQKIPDPEGAAQKRIVFTGAPYGGKTTFLKRIAEDYQAEAVYIPEVIGLLKQTGMDLNTPQGQRIVYALKYLIEQAAARVYPERLVFVDRGTLDGAAYWPAGREAFLREIGGQRRELERYGAVIQMQSVATTKHAGLEYHDRVENADRTAVIEDELAEVWRNHERYYFVPHGDWDEKTREAERIIHFVKDRLQAGAKAPRVFDFEHKGLHYRYPNIDAYDFEPRMLESFLSRSHDAGVQAPLVMDLHFKAPCGLRCIFCYTEGGVTDERHAVDEKKFGMMEPEDIREAIRQYAVLGGHTLILLSIGEPLTNVNQFMEYAELAQKLGVRVVTFTNMLLITPDVAERLRKAEVNMLLKLNHLDAAINNQLAGREKPYKYVEYKGQRIPQQLVNVLEAYRDRPDLLALSSDITRLNADNILVISRWAYERLGMAHFRKHLYYFGFAQANRDQLVLSDEEALAFDKTVYAFDRQYGYEYPAPEEFTDQYSFDMRRFLNNNASVSGFPVRSFAHYLSGIYHSSEKVQPKHGYKKGIQVALKNTETGKVDAEDFFRQIFRHILFFKGASRRLEKIEASFQSDRAQSLDHIQSQPSRQQRWEDAYLLTVDIKKYLSEYGEDLAVPDRRRLKGFLKRATELARENVLYWVPKTPGLTVIGNDQLRSAYPAGEKFQFFSLEGESVFYTDPYQITYSIVPPGHEQAIHGHFFTQELSVALEPGLRFHLFQIEHGQAVSTEAYDVPEFSGAFFGIRTPHSLLNPTGKPIRNMTVKYGAQVTDRWDLKEAPAEDTFTFEGGVRVPLSETVGSAVRHSFDKGDLYHRVVVLQPGAHYPYELAGGAAKGWFVVEGTAMVSAPLLGSENVSASNGSLVYAKGKDRAGMVLFSNDGPERLVLAEVELKESLFGRFQSAIAKNYHALISDVDGVLTDPVTGKISEQTLGFLAEKIQQGIPVLLISGRNETAFGQGYRKQAPSLEEVAAQLRSLLVADGHEQALEHLFLASENGVVISNGFNREDPRRIDYLTGFETAVITLREQTNLIDGLKALGLVDEHVRIENKTHGFVLKDSFGTRVAGIARELEKELKARGLEETFEVLASQDEGAVYVYPRGSNKRKGLEFMVKQFGFNAEDVVVFADRGGPGELDHDLLEAAAGFSTDTVAEGGKTIQLRALSGFLPGAQSFMWAAAQLKFSSRVVSLKARSEVRSSINENLAAVLSQINISPSDARKRLAQNPSEPVSYLRTYPFTHHRDKRGYLFRRSADYTRDQKKDVVRLLLPLLAELGEVPLTLMHYYNSRISQMIDIQSQFGLYDLARKTIVETMTHRASLVVPVNKETPEEALAKFKHQNILKVAEAELKAGYFDQVYALLVRANDDTSLTYNWDITMDILGRAGYLREIVQQLGDAQKSEPYWGSKKRQAVSKLWAQAGQFDAALSLISDKTNEDDWLEATVAIGQAMAEAGELGRARGLLSEVTRYSQQHFEIPTQNRWKLFWRVQQMIKIANLQEAVGLEVDDILQSLAKADELFLKFDGYDHESILPQLAEVYAKWDRDKAKALMAQAKEHFFASFTYTSYSDNGRERFLDLFDTLLNLEMYDEAQSLMIDYKAQRDEAVRKSREPVDFQDQDRLWQKMIDARNRNQKPPMTMAEEIYFDLNAGITKLRLKSLPPDGSLAMTQIAQALSDHLALGQKTTGLEERQNRLENSVWELMRYLRQSNPDEIRGLLKDVIQEPGEAEAVFEKDLLRFTLSEMGQALYANPVEHRQRVVNILKRILPQHFAVSSERVTNPLSFFKRAWFLFLRLLTWLHLLPAKKQRTNRQGPLDFVFSRLEQEMKKNKSKYETLRHHAKKRARFERELLERSQNALNLVQLLPALETLAPGRVPYTALYAIAAGKNSREFKGIEQVLKAVESYPILKPLAAQLLAPASIENSNKRNSDYGKRLRVLQSISDEVLPLLKHAEELHVSKDQLKNIFQSLEAMDITKSTWLDDLIRWTDQILWSVIDNVLGRPVQAHPAFKLTNDLMNTVIYQAFLNDDRLRTFLLLQMEKGSHAVWRAIAGLPGNEPYAKMKAWLKGPGVRPAEVSMKKDVQDVLWQKKEEILLEVRGHLTILKEQNPTWFDEAAFEIGIASQETLKIFVETLQKKLEGAQGELLPVIAQHLRDYDSVDQALEVRFTEPVSIEVSQEPVEILNLGAGFQSCLDCTAANDYRRYALAMLLDLNKRVLFVKDSSGKRIGRLSLALTDQGLMPLSKIYNNTTLDLEPALLEYLKKYAELLAVPLILPELVFPLLQTGGAASVKVQLRKAVAQSIYSDVIGLIHFSGQETEVQLAIQAREYRPPVLRLRDVKKYGEQTEPLLAELDSAAAEKLLGYFDANRHLNGIYLDGMTLELLTRWIASDFQDSAVTMRVTNNETLDLLGPESARSEVREKQARLEGDNRVKTPRVQEIRDLVTPAAVFLDVGELARLEPESEVIRQRMDELLALLTQYKNLDLYLDGADRYPVESIHNTKFQQLLEKYSARIHIGMFDRARLAQKKIVIHAALFESSASADETTKKMARLKEEYKVSSTVLPLDYTKPGALKAFLGLAELGSAAELIRKLSDFYAARGLNGRWQVAETYAADVWKDFVAHTAVAWAA